MVTATRPKRRDAKPEPPKPAPPQVRLVALDDIRTDGGTQCREKTDEGTVANYAADMEAGDQFPPLLVVEDDEESLWLFDGFHRLLSLRRIGWEAVKCEVRRGTLDDARLLALTVNRKHRALRFSNADKRHAVKQALGWWPGDSDRLVAEKAEVSHTFVAEVRRQVATVATCETRTGKDGRQYPAPKPEPQSPPAEPPRLIDRPDIVDGPDEEDPWREVSDDEEETPTPSGKLAFPPPSQGDRDIAEARDIAARMAREAKETAAKPTPEPWRGIVLEHAVAGPVPKALAKAGVRTLGELADLMTTGKGIWSVRGVWHASGAVFLDGVRDIWIATERGEAGERPSWLAPWPRPAKATPRTMTLHETGLTEEALGRASVICAWDKAKGIVNVRPVTIGSPWNLYVYAGGRSGGTTGPAREWHLLPLYAEENYDAFHAENFPPCDRPVISDERRRSGDCDTGVRVKVRGKVFVIGPASEALHVVLPREKPVTERESGDDSEEVAAEEERDRKIRPGKALWDWKPYEAAFGSLVRQVDALGLAYRAAKSFEANNLLGLLRDFDADFREWQSDLAKAGVN